MICSEPIDARSTQRKIGALRAVFRGRIRGVPKWQSPSGLAVSVRESHFWVLCVRSRKVAGYVERDFRKSGFGTEIATWVGQTIFPAALAGRQCRPIFPRSGGLESDLPPKWYREVAEEIFEAGFE